jgi:hypothetical protein
LKLLARKVHPRGIQRLVAVSPPTGAEFSSPTSTARLHLGSAAAARSSRSAPVHVKVWHTPGPVHCRGGLPTCRSSRSCARQERGYCGPRDLQAIRARTCQAPMLVANWPRATIRPCRVLSRESLPRTERRRVRAKRARSELRNPGGIGSPVAEMSMLDWLRAAGRQFSKSHRGFQLSTRRSERCPTSVRSARPRQFHVGAMSTRLETLHRRQ